MYNNITRIDYLFCINLNIVEYKYQYIMQTKRYNASINLNIVEYKCTPRITI